MGAVLVGGCSQLAAFNTFTPKDPAMRVAEDVTYDSASGLTLDIYSPRDAAGPAPVVVWFFGGSWDSGRKEDYAFAARAIASRGFVTVVPDYRLVPDVVYPAFVEDGAAAVSWVQDNIAAFGGDPEVMFLAGHSAGAYNVMQMTLNPRFFEQADVDPSVIRGVAGVAGPYDFLPLDVEVSQAAFGPYDDLEDTQPVNFARGGLPPILLLHGAADETVGLYNSQNLRDAVRAAGSIAELKVYEGVDHIGIMLALSRPFRGRASTLEDVTQFFDQRAAAVK